MNKEEEFKTQILQAINEKKFDHGIAVAKEDIGELIKKGEPGIITAYLPEDNTFAVMFKGEGRWYTFKDNEQWFLEHFDVIRDIETAHNSNSDDN